MASNRKPKQEVKKIDTSLTNRKHYVLNTNTHCFRVYEFGKDHACVSMDGCLGVKIVRTEDNKIAYYKWEDHRWKPKLKWDFCFDILDSQEKILMFINKRVEQWDK